MIRRLDAEEKLTELYSQRQYELDYYRSGYLHMEEFRKIRHDFMNQIQTAYFLLHEENRDITRIRETGYREKERICQTLEACKRDNWCENPVLDAVLAIKWAEVQKKRISMEISCHVGKQCALSETEICSLFGNLLDNAIEACEKATAMRSFLCDRRRFADLFNGILFRGHEIIQAEDLQEASEQYAAMEDGVSERARDIKMSMRTGETLCVLALENQSSVDYTLPYRCMQYDSLGYGKQLEELKRSNREAKSLRTPAEWLCGFAAEDRLTPVYTLCLYHGEEPWNGPLALRDMMDFGEDKDHMSRFFADYPLRLFCVNGQEDFSNFHTELREVFTVLAHRRDKKRLYAAMTESAFLRRLDKETLKVLSVLLDVPGLWEGRKRFMSVSEEKEEEYDMCQAIRELLEDAKNDGMSEGMSQGITQGLSSNLLNRLMQRLLEDNRLEDLKKSVSDTVFQEQLLREYQLVE